MNVRLTVADRLLIAAYILGRDKGNEFTAEELVVASWEQYPEVFGLRGILNDAGRPRFPDSNRVFAEIMGSKPLRKNGLLDKIGDKRYRLTEAGIQRASVLAGQTEEPSAEFVGKSIDRQLQDSIRRLLQSRAVAKFRDGRVAEITFFDACSFLGISPKISAMKLKARLADLEATLKGVKEHLQGRDLSLGGREATSASDIDTLISLYERILELFVDEFSIILQRTDER